ncbi:SusD-like starch-binding protein associating with outer membrane [Chitinophaga skermanii]|uniref:SusD-like starch-binding protein associating with outer membrane n=1 Tax=Chitinophaga skermanii TaxID=331697 RepID=A0A327Q650_9BACT|nr:SusD/RagB family nutrient-binding outer membrane lipoprotein [Chitinophaga skermanii]RAI99454.1 SusD-like starch-binding protein associating with outer membrane [Chitinophaga skermanii]
MKQVISKLIYTISLPALFFAACSDDKLAGINDDPNRPTDVPTSTILVTAEKSLLDNARGSSFNFKGAILFSQYFAQNIYTNESRYDYAKSYSDSYWDGTYKALNNLERIIQLNSDSTTKGKAAFSGPNANQIAIARILKTYAFLSLTDAFGDIPYSSYGNKDADFQALTSNLKPKYAAQEKIYPDLLKELKEAATQLDVSANTFGNSDVIYKGNPLQWRKFANSLRLRIAIRIKKRQPAVAETHIQEAIAGGVFTSNADNAILKYEAKAPNEAPLYRATVTENRKDYAVSHVLINALQGKIGPFTTPDPRLAAYAKTNSAGLYVGQPYGLPAEAASILKAEDVSLPGAIVNAADYGEVLMEYSEVAFLLSEYNNWSQQWYEAGVKASFEKWAVNGTAYVAALPAANQENVLTQKYLALYMQSNEAWAEIRRTGYPHFLVKSGDVVWTRTTTDGSTISYKFTQLFGNGIPQRIYYPQKEQSVNLQNYQSAIANQGNDNIETKPWWNK